MVCRLKPDEPYPDWIPKGFSSITKTTDELSIVCKQLALEKVKCERGWRLIKVLGPLDFSEIGILSSLSSILASAQISVFVISTFDTDYLMIKKDKLAQAINVLGKAGHEILEG